MTRLYQTIICVVIFVLIASSISAAVVPEFTFDCIVQSGTSIPGSSFLLFDELSQPTPVRGDPDTVLFLGADQYGSTPSYMAYAVSNGTITPYTYFTTYTGPKGPVTTGIYGARCPSSDHGVAAFVAREEGRRVPQFFLAEDDSTECVFENDSFTYHGIINEWYRNDTIVFSAYGGMNEQIHGVYSYDINSQVVTTIAENRTPLPDGNAVSRTSFACYDGNQIAFRASGSSALPGYSGTCYGVYMTTESGALRTVANRATPIPGTSCNFFNFKDLVLDDGYIYFIGDDNNQDYNTGGIFREKDGVIEWLYEWDRVYEETRTIDDLDGLSVYNGNLAFIKNFKMKTLYTIIEGVTTPVIQEGDILDGKTVSDLDIGNEALGEGVLAFSVTFNDNSHAIYTASFDVTPEPSTIALLLTLMVGSALWRRR